MAALQAAQGDDLGCVLVRIVEAVVGPGQPLAVADHQIGAVVAWQYAPMASKSALVAQATGNGNVSKQSEGV